MSSENEHIPAVVAAGDPDVAKKALESHVPLSLLMDIADAEGLDSERIAEVEGGDADWLQPGHANAEPEVDPRPEVALAD